MTHEDVLALIRDNPKLLPEAELVETHISWVILTEKVAYKLKKPVEFSFLNFSSLDKRKFFCERELTLNRRLTTNVYLDVIPIFKKEDEVFTFLEEDATIVDYAVKMKRLDGDRQMHLLLENKEVKPEHMEQLAQQLANFHMSTDVVMAHPKLKTMQADFADLLKVIPFIETHWGADAALLLHKSVEHSEFVLNTLRARIYERHLEGFTVDGHGDLHSKNIFLLDKPVIFDCIEFNDHFRKLDVLNELAFLCMDLDFHRQPELGNSLLHEYNQRYICISNNEDEKLFEYYKLYRANVRLKVSTLNAMQMEAGPALKKQRSLIADFLDLYEDYLT